LIFRVNEHFHALHPLAKILDVSLFDGLQLLSGFLHLGAAFGLGNFSTR
jgi:hypothetical protein